MSSSGAFVSEDDLWRASSLVFGTCSGWDMSWHRRIRTTRDANRGLDHGSLTCGSDGPKTATSLTCSSCVVWAEPASPFAWALGCPTRSPLTRETDSVLPSRACSSDDLLVETSLSAFGSCFALYQVPLRRTAAPGRMLQQGQPRVIATDAGVIFAYSVESFLSTTACTGLIEEPSVMSMNRTPELLRTDRTQPQTSTSGTLVPGFHALRSATLLIDE